MSKFATTSLMDETRNSYESYIGLTMQPRSCSKLPSSFEPDGTTDSRTLLGELLGELGWIGPEQLAEALEESTQTKLPLGRVLVSKNWLTDIELRAAIEAQSMLRDGQLDRVQVRQALYVVSWTSASFICSLKLLGLFHLIQGESNRLGELLIASGLITEEDLQAALKASHGTGLPLGRSLVFLNAIPGTHLATALNIQRLIRDGALTRPLALNGLSAINRHLGEEPDQPEHTTLRLGDLLVSTKIVSRSDLDIAKQVALINGKPIGELLVVFGLITGSTLTAALELQALVNSGTLTVRQAGQVLNRVVHHGIPMDQALSEIKTTKRSDDNQLLKFLRQVGALSEAELKNLPMAALESTEVLTRALVLSGKLDTPSLRAAIRCKFLVQKSILNLQQACFAFHHCRNSGQDIDEFLRNAGWYNPELYLATAQGKIA